MLPGHPTYITT